MRAAHPAAGPPRQGCDALAASCSICHTAPCRTLGGPARALPRAASSCLQAFTCLLGVPHRRWGCCCPILHLLNALQIKQNVLLKYKYLAGFLKQHAPDIYAEVSGATHCAIAGLSQGRARSAPAAALPVHLSRVRALRCSILAAFPATCSTISLFPTL